MANAFSTILNDNFSLVVFQLDIPCADWCETSSFKRAIDAIIMAAKLTKKKTAIISSVPEAMTETLAIKLIKEVITTLGGLETAAL